MGLKEIRREIDIIDRKLLNLLNSRMERVLTMRKFKEHIEDPKREKELLEHVRSRAGRLVDPEFGERLFNTVLDMSKALQRKKCKLIAFQGEHGAYSEQAAIAWKSEYVPIACAEFVDVFDGVASGQYDFAIVPVETTRGGDVGQVNDLLINADLHIVGAIDLPIHHCLLSTPDTSHREIKTVYSHPEVLAQCRQFLARNKLEQRHHYDTAGAAKWLKEDQPKATAVVAGRLAAEQYDLDVLVENIEDMENNRTRFLILSKEPAREGGRKESIVFTTEHKVGTLFHVLEHCTKHEVNLTRIESIPTTLGEHAFFIDYILPDGGQSTSKMHEEMRTMTRMFKLLGNYEELVVE